MEPEQIRNRIVGPIAYPTTPFDKTGQNIDVESFRKEIRFLVDNHISLVAVCGGTGEFFSLEFPEWETLVRAALEETRGKEVIVIPSVGGAITQAVKMAKSAEEMGAGMLQMTFLDPMFGITEDGIYEYNRQIASSVSIAVMPYKTKSVPMSVELAKKICEMKNAVIFKEESGDAEWFKDFMFATKRSVVGVCGGGESLAPYYIALGAKAFTTGVVNLLPQLSLELYKAAVENRWDKILEIQTRLRSLTKVREKPGRMIPVIKEGLKMMGIIREAYSRPPVAPLNPDEKKELERALKELGAL